MWLNVLKCFEEYSWRLTSDQSKVSRNAGETIVNLTFDFKKWFHEVVYIILPRHNSAEASGEKNEQVHKAG